MFLSLRILLEGSLRVWPETKPGTHHAETNAGEQIWAGIRNSPFAVVPKPSNSLGKTVPQRGLSARGPDSV